MDAKPSNKSKCSGPMSFEAIRMKSLSYPKWCTELVSNVLRTRTPFASFLAKTIRLTRTSRIAKSSTPTFFPVPLPTLGAFNRMSIDSSADSKHTRHLTQAVHVLVCALNYWYSGGRHGDMELLMRGPSKQHLLLYARIRSLIVSDGPAVVEQVPAAGRRFPELSARLGELSDFLTRVGCTANPYDKSYAGCPVAKDDAVDEKLQPYHDMDPTKILLFGNGSWDPVPFLEDNLCLAFLEPKVLLHGGKAPAGPLIRDAEETAAALAKKWDDLGLLRLHKQPVHRDSPVRIFGALKSSEVHRQIGDRRGQNARECKVEGPSCDLPAGPDFGELFVDCKTETISLSITDRKDFYHQLRCSPSKAYMNTIGPPVDERLVSNTKAYSEFLIQDSRKRYSRTLQGDMLKEEILQDMAHLEQGKIWIAFNSVLQGDHAGVEVATQAHSNMLMSYGLLKEDHRVRACRPLRSLKRAEGLVIDDYFSISIQPRGTDHQDAAAFRDYCRAQRAYKEHDLMGSPHKDIVGADEGKVIGAYINGGPLARNQGMVTVAAPAEKRLALSYLSLLVSQLTYTTDALHLCMLGGWTSILGYRRPMMSILQKAFKVVQVAEFDKNNPKLVPLSRSVAEELTLLAVLMPLAVIDLGVPFDDQVYCTDASNQRGAVLAAPICPKVGQVLWKCARSKGAYSRLLTPMEALMKHLDILEEEEPEETKGGVDRPIAFAFEFLEIFAGASKISLYLHQMGINVGPPLDISESPEYDLRSNRVIEWLSFLVAEKRLLGFFLGPPCTTFSIMRRPRLRSAFCPYGFDVQDPQTATGTLLAQRSFQLMKVGDQNTSCGILETPYSSYMKHLPSWGHLRDLDTTSETRCDSCRYDSPHLKSFRFLGLRVDLSLVSLRCVCTKRHVQVEGSLTKGSATYTDPLAFALAQTLFRSIQALKAQLREDADLHVKGLENQLTNCIMISSGWKVLASWSFRRASHINILEEASVLRLCQLIARRGKPVRITVIVDSNVVRCATSKGRTSSVGLGSILRRVCALQVAAGIYLHAAFVPTRLNVADDPTRSSDLREPLECMDLENMSVDQLFELGSITKTKRWASNWVRFVIRLMGPDVFLLHDRSLYPQRKDAAFNTRFFRRLDSTPVNSAMPLPTYMDFDQTLGYPGEGPVMGLTTNFCIFVICCGFSMLCAFSQHPRPCRLILCHTGSFVFLVFMCICRLFCPVGCWGLLLLAASGRCGAMAMPILTATPGERRKSALRNARPPLTLGRPVTDTTVKLRQRYWEIFITWTHENALDFEAMLEHSYSCVDEINIVMTRYGRLLYQKGKSYNQYAETLNALGSYKPSMRRLLQQSWDLGYAWVKSEPSTHHVAMPTAIVISMISIAIFWGWPLVAGV